jgi:hypothetical protein
VVDYSFRAVGGETLARAWPAFLVFSVAQAMFARRVQRHGPPALVWRLAILATAVAACFALWLVSERTVDGFYPTYGVDHEGRSSRLELRLWIARPTLWAFVAAQAALLVIPRSHMVAPLATVVPGVALSWVIAIWLMMASFPRWMLDVFGIPGSLGGLASALGFVASSAVWMATQRQARPTSRPTSTRSG